MTQSDSPRLAQVFAPELPENADDRARQLLAYWKQLGPEGWFAKDDAIDAHLRDNYMDLHLPAARGQCDHSLEQADTGLALVLLLDQFPRNVFRDTAHMFATDGLARKAAQTRVDNDVIEDVDESLRLFVCLPFVHSEDIADQEVAQSLYARWAPNNAKWAKQHREIIVRFGRFPHRNRSMGRTTLADEQAFLDDGGFTG